MTVPNVSTDYLVVGAGISGLSFVDELLNHTSASILIVDKRDAPGGHWNDSYSFVKLHQPSHFYGVGSRELAEYRIDEQGPNKGFLSLASGPEVISYCHALMKERLIPSGRVTYLPSTEYLPSDGSLRGLLSKKRITVAIRKRLVDATYYTNNIPLDHTRSFNVDSSVTCIPPNHLPKLANKFKHYTVLGGGKTAMDSCLWLLANGAHPSQLRWVVPHDYWYFNRAKFQPGEEFFEDVFNSFADRMSIVAEATDAQDFALRMEKAKIWLRLDPNVYPQMFHAAVMSPNEVDELRKIQDVIRNGYVKDINASSISLTTGTVESPRDTLYIDCTASAITFKPLVPVFQPSKIVLQMIKFPFIPVSAATIALLESLPMDDKQRNSFTSPVGFGKTVEDYLFHLPADLQNQVRLNQHPKLREWIKSSRLDGFTSLAAAVRPDETKKVDILKRLRQATTKALANVNRLAATTATATTPRPML